MDKVFIGIDPGASGYICALAPESKQVEFLSNVEKPNILFEMLTTLRKNFNVQMAMIEDVHSIPSASAKSNFSFGWNCGLLHGILGCTGIGLDMVQPKIWQKHIGIKTPTRKKGAPKIPASVRTAKMKNDVAKICERLYPEVNIRGPKGGLKDGMSDALMIAHYCSHIYR
jgi:hypothetical protein